MAEAFVAEFSVAENLLLERSDDPRFRQAGLLSPAKIDAEAKWILENFNVLSKGPEQKLRELSGRALPVIHIIGGASRNRLLNQFTADATGCEVIAGPVEATAIGNILLQGIALGHLSSLAEGRASVRRSFDVTSYEPHQVLAWDEAYSRYLALRER